MELSPHFSIDFALDPEEFGSFTWQSFRDFKNFQELTIKAFESL